ncbi:MAG: ATP-grasp domain-containing protein [Bacteroidales bacterium]|jgi:carbamoyl-phosphate synthase large subunit|nr:ATP-grasp domain-containing protein [Bacteroidales bacterium]
MKKLLILGAGIIQVPIIIKARDLDLYTIVLDKDQKAPGISYSDEFHAISTDDTERVLELAIRRSIDGILTTSDYPVNVVAAVAKQLNLPGIPVELAKLCTNKYAQRHFFHQNNINIPKHKLINSINDLFSIDFFPCIMKPVDSSASKGVKMIHNQKELLEQYPISKEFSRLKLVIVEEFIHGREFSVETLSQHGKTHIVQITEKQTIGEGIGYFVEDTHITPARITFEENNNIEKTVYDVLHKMRIDNCPTHTELKLNEKGIFIIEIACRLGGDYIASDLVPLSTGVDMLKNVILLSLGKEINIEKTLNKVASVQFINTNNYTRCVEFIKQNNSFVVKSEIYPYIGKEIKNSNDRLGYIILNTPDIQLMEQLLIYIK